MDAIGHDLERINTNIDIPGEDRHPCYVVKNRLKSVSDIVGKVERKRLGAPINSAEYNYSPEHVTDGLGYRFVTLFHEDILLVVKELIKLFKHQSPYTDNQILKVDGLKEATIYTNRPPKEEGAVHTRVAEILEAEGFEPVTLPPINRKSGYSSVHFVVQVPVKKKGDSHQTPQSMEIQVRDIFEESWSEIDHTLRYVNEREGADEEDVYSATWLRHLNALKTFADGCSQHASMIKTNAIDMRKMRSLSVGKIPSDEPTAGAELLKAVLPATFQGDIDAAYAAEERAVAAISKRTAKLEFLAASDQFKDLITRAKRYHSKKTSDGRDVAFHLYMEYAFCLQPAPGNGVESQKVIDIYERMRERFPNDPFTYYRQGSALSQRKQLDEAQSLLEEGIVKLNENSAIPDTAWVRAAMPRLLGLVHWRQGIKAGEMGNTPEQITRYKNAIKFTEDAANAAADGAFKEHIKCLNNLVYYMYDYLKVTNSDDDFVTRKNLKTKVGELHDKVQPGDPSYLNRLHTIMMVQSFLGETETAKNVAHSIAAVLYEIAKGNSGDELLPIHLAREHLDPELHEIYDDVVKLLFGGI